MGVDMVLFYGVAEDGQREDVGVCVHGRHDRALVGTGLLIALHASTSFARSGWTRTTSRHAERALVLKGPFHHVQVTPNVAPKQRERIPTS